jgi:uncharacterized membrane-anchored protein
MMSAGRHGHRESFEERHAEIIGRTLRWADDAAERGDWSEALRWVEKVRSLGVSLSADYEAKRQAWLQAVDRFDTVSEQADPHRSRRSASG